MNKLAKTIFGLLDNWYQTCIDTSNQLGHKQLHIELIKHTSNIIVKDVSNVELNKPIEKEFKEVYIRMINGLVKLCNDQANLIKSQTIPFKLFKKNIKHVKSEFKKGYKK